MNTPYRVTRRRQRPTLVLGLIGLLSAMLLGVLAPPRLALAHALDAYLQATYITVTPTQIEVELDLTPGVLLAPEVLPQLDSDGDQHISDAEGRAYVDAMLSNVVLQVDAKQLALAVTQIDMPPYLNLQAGYGTIRIFTTATPAAGLTGTPTRTHQIDYQNNFAPTGSVYQVNAFVTKDVSITLGKQNRDSIQQRMTMDYVIGSAAPTTAVPATQPAGTTITATTETEGLAPSTGTSVGASEQTQQLLAYLYAPTLTPGGLLVALALAGVLGGLHALTPGHGKTLVAAYLVGSRGTPKHAIWLGSVTTLTHTVSVLAVGVLALTAQQFTGLDLLVPVLEVGSGVLVVLMGVRLVLARWRSMRAEDTAHVSAHNHGFGTHSHALGAGAHTHTRMSRGGILAMGVSGGLIPCPEALGLMLLAIGLNRAGFGLALIVAFSLGLAAVLIGLGMLLVRSKSLIERFGGLNVRWLSLASACVVTVLGVGLVLKGLFM